MCEVEAKVSVVRCSDVENEKEKKEEQKEKNTSECYTSCDSSSLSLKENYPLTYSTGKDNFNQDTKKVEIPEYLSQEGIEKFFLNSSDGVSGESLFCEPGCTPSNSAFLCKMGCTPKKGAFFFFRKRFRKTPC